MTNSQLTVPVKVSCVINIFISSITCPFTVLLNVLVILVVKNRPRLRNKPILSTLLAFLAVTDALNGDKGQPALIIVLASQDQLNPTVCRHVSKLCHTRLVYLLGASLDVSNVTTRYHYIVTDRNIKVAVTAFWIVSFFLHKKKFPETKLYFQTFLADFVLIHVLFLLHFIP